MVSDYTASDGRLVGCTDDNRQSPCPLVILAKIDGEDLDVMSFVSADVSGEEYNIIESSVLIYA